MRRRPSNKFANPNMQISSALQNESRAESSEPGPGKRSGIYCKPNRTATKRSGWMDGWVEVRGIWGRRNPKRPLAEHLSCGRAFRFLLLIFHKPVFVLSFALVSGSGPGLASAAAFAANSSAISVFVQIPCWKIYRLVGSCILCFPILFPLLCYSATLPPCLRATIFLLPLSLF